MNVTRAVAALAALPSLVVFGAACGDRDDAEATALQGVRRDPPLEVGDVTLPDVTDANPAFAMAAQPGGLLLVYFGYTSCPDICPTTMSDISTALERLAPSLASRVDVAMVTVDPERDTAEVLDGYLAHFFDDATRHALRTEDPAQLEAAKQAFGVRSEIEVHRPGDDDYEVAHTAVTYAVDGAGRVVVEWPFGTTADAIRSDLETLLEEARA